MEVARICEDLLGDADRAEKVYRRVLAIDPTDPTLVIPAAQALGRIYAAKEQHQALAGVLGDRGAPRGRTSRRGASLYERIGTLHETVLDDPAKAIEAWQARLGDDGADVAALGCARAALRADVAVAASSSPCSGREEQSTTEPEERRRAMTKAAETLAQKLADVPEAITAWRAVLDEFGPERPDARGPRGALRARRALGRPRRARWRWTCPWRWRRPPGSTSWPGSATCGGCTRAICDGRARGLPAGAARSTRRTRAAARRSRRCSSASRRARARRPRRCGRSTRRTATPSASSGSWRSRSRRPSISERAARHLAERRSARRRAARRPVARVRLRAPRRAGGGGRARGDDVDRTRSSGSVRPPGAGPRRASCFQRIVGRTSSTATCSRTCGSASASSRGTSSGDTRSPSREYKKALDAQGPTIGAP